MAIFKQIKLMKTVCAATCMAAGIAVYAADVSETFEDKTDKPIDWEGYGTIDSVTPPAPSPAGYPLPSRAHSKVLNVDGFVTVPVAEASAGSVAGSTVDMMVKIVLPDEPLDFPTTEQTEDVQVALGIDQVVGQESKGEVKVWNGAWQATGKIFDADDWVRVTFRFDYNGSPKKCQFLVNGEPVLVNGNSWIDLPGTPTKVQSVKLVGSTAIDDMVVKAGALTQLPVTTKVNGVTDMTVADNVVTAAGGIKVDKQWLTDNGIVWTADAVNAKAVGETMTIAQKYAAGFEPTAEGAVLKIQDMKMLKDGESVKVQVTLPVGKAGNGYENVVQTKGATGDWDAGIAVDAQGKATITLPSEGGVRYYRVVTKAK